MSSPKVPVRRRIIGFVIAVAALAWTAYLLSGAWDIDALRSITPAPIDLGIAFLLTITSMLVAFPSFWWLLRGASDSTPPIGEMLALHFTAQLMRHIPGRFAGVVYQIAIARHLASATQWIGVNILHVAIALWFSLVVPLLLLLLTGELEARIALVGLLALFAAPYVAVRALRFGLSRAPDHRFIPARKVLSAVHGASRRHSFVKAVLWFAASWLLYALAWAIFGASLPALDMQDGLVLCALYTIAWAIGFVSIVTPSGLGVRELAFATLASSYSPEIVLFVVIVARVGLLLADIVLGLLSIFFGRFANA